MIDSHNTCMKMVKDLIINDIIFKNTSDPFTYKLYHVWNITHNNVDGNEIVILTLMANSREVIHMEYFNNEIKNYVLAQKIHDEK